MKNKFIFLTLFLALSPALCYAQDTALLGGMVQSDRWIIRKDKMEEEFIGNVSYKNDIYTAKADYALSRRREQTFNLKGNVFASQKKNGTTAQITAENFFYNNKTGEGYATPKKNAQVNAVYTTQTNRLKAFGNKLDFKDKFSVFEMSGNCELDEINNTLYADKMIFDTNSGVFNAHGNRPVLWGFNPDGDYAVQADDITVQTKEGFLKAQGRVQGWVVSAKEFPNLTQGSKNGTEIF